jgi:hypothetical protein
MKTRAAILLVLVSLFGVTESRAMRWYSSSTGRWLSRDPLGEPGFQALQVANTEPRLNSPVPAQPAWLISPNGIENKVSKGLYIFTKNNSMQYSDPLGMDDFQVVGGPVNAPDPSESWLRRFQRRIGRLLSPITDGVDHVNIYHGHYQLRVGYGGGNLRPLPDPRRAKERVWALSIVRQGKLRWGQVPGKPCTCATHQDIASCVSSAPAPNINNGYSVLVNNCQQDVQRAIEGCCLEGFAALPMGPFEEYYMTDEERGAYISSMMIPSGW